MVWYYTDSSLSSIMHTPSILHFFQQWCISPYPSDKYVRFELCRGHRGSSSSFQSTRGTLNPRVLFIRVINDEWNLSQKWHIISLKSMTVTKSLFFDCCSSVLGWVFAGWHTKRKIYCEDSESQYLNMPLEMSNCKLKTRVRSDSFRVFFFELLLLFAEYKGHCCVIWVLRTFFRASYLPNGRTDPGW